MVRRSRRTLLPYFLAVALAPVVMSRLIAAAPLTHDTYELPKVVVVRLLAAIALLAWSVEWRRSGELRRSWWLAPLGIFGTWTALATAFSGSPATSLLGMHGRLLGLATTLTYVVLAFVSFQVFESSHHLIPLTRAVTLSGFLVTLYGVLQVVHLDPFYYFPTDEFTAGRVFSTFGNPVFLGGFLTLLVPVVVTMALSEQSRLWSVFGWATFVLAIVTLLGTATRSAWLVVFAEVVCLAVIARRKRLLPGALGIGAIVIAGMLGVAQVIVGLSSSSPVLNVATRATSVLTGGDGSTTERMMVAQAALRAIGARPLLGFGPDRFVIAFRMFRPEAHVLQFPANIIDNAHSVPLQVAATAGVVAALAWLMCIALPLPRLAPLTFSPSGTQGRVLFAGMWVAVAGYALFSFAGIQVVGAEALFWVLLGVLAGTTAGVAATTPRVWGSVLVGVSAVVVVAATVWGIVLLGADHDFLRARMQVRGYAAGDQVASVRQAAELSPLDITYLRQLWIVTDPADRAAQNAELEQALAIEPDDFDSLVALRDLAVARDNTSLASSLLSRIQTVAPNDPRQSL